jgi:hypothetical protein
MNKRFAANVLSLNTDKTNAIKFNLSHSQEDSFQISYEDKKNQKAINIKFIGLEIDQHLNWKTHIQQIIP